MPIHLCFDFTKKPTLTTSCEVECELFSDHLESKQFHLSLPLWPVRWSSSQCGHRSQSRATWLKVVGSGGTWQTKELRLVGFYFHVATQTMKSTWLLGTSRPATDEILELHLVRLVANISLPAGSSGCFGLFPLCCAIVLRKWDDLARFLGLGLPSCCC